MFLYDKFFYKLFFGVLYVFQLLLVDCSGYDMYKVDDDVEDRVG